MRTNVDESKTMAAFNAGCPLAFKIIFDKKFREICRFIAFMVRDKQQAEDITAEIFIELWNRHGKFSSFEKIESFLFISAKNRIRHFWKGKQRSLVEPVDSSVITNIADDSTDYGKITMELLNLVHNNMHCLSSQRARIVSMVILGMDDKDISRTMGISAKTVRNQRMSAVHYFRSILPGKLNRF